MGPDAVPNEQTHFQTVFWQRIASETSLYPQAGVKPGQIFNVLWSNWSEQKLQNGFWIILRLQKMLIVTLCSLHMQLRDTETYVLFDEFSTVLLVYVPGILSLLGGQCWRVHPLQSTALISTCLHLGHLIGIEIIKWLCCSLSTLKPNLLTSVYKCVNIFLCCGLLHSSCLVADWKTFFKKLLTDLFNIKLRIISAI